MSLIVAIADYAARFTVRSESAFAAARRYLIEALAGGFESLRDPECASLVAPLVPGAVMPGGARVPGTSLELDPAQAAFCLGVMLCSSTGEDWLDLPYGCGTASLAAVLAIADYLARKASMEGKAPPTIRDLLAANIKALEIQCVLAPISGEPSGWAASLRLARLAAAAVAATQLGATQRQIVTALSYVSVDGGVSTNAEEPRRRARRDWILADAMSRAVRHACQAVSCERASPATPIDLEIPELVGSSLGTAFGTEFIARLTNRESPQEIARVAMRFQAAVDRHFPVRQAERIKVLFASPPRLDDLPVSELLAALVTNGAR
ncbi:MAG: MmgE/PrpD family protein [Steroidobacteraceae bacterium]